MPHYESDDVTNTDHHVAGRKEDDGPLRVAEWMERKQLLINICNFNVKKINLCKY